MKNIFTLKRILNCTAVMIFFFSILSFYCIAQPPLLWSSYFGGNGNDRVNSLKVDHMGNIYVAGSIGLAPFYNNNNTSFPWLNPGGGTFFNNSVSGWGGETFIAKFSNTGAQLWCTYITGANGNGAVCASLNEITVDDSDYVYVVGTSPYTETYKDFTGPYAGAYSTSSLNSSAGATFIIKFDSTGKRLWETPIFISPFGVEMGIGVTVDKYGNSYITGEYNSNPSPTTNPYAFNMLKPSGNAGAYYDTSYCGCSRPVIIKFDRFGKIRWGTEFGDSSSNCHVYEAGEAMTTNSKGDFFWGGIFVNNGGNTTAATGKYPLFNPGGTAYYQSFFKTITSGVDDYTLYFAKFDSGGVLKWGTFFGGTPGTYGGSEITDMKTDSKDNVYVVGYTDNLDFPYKNPGGGAYYNGSPAINATNGFYSFIIKFRQDGTLVWSTAFAPGDANGPDYYNEAYSIAIGKDDDIYITGKSASGLLTLNPSGGGYYQSSITTTNTAAFIAHFDSTGVLKYSTYFGDGVGMTNVGGRGLDLDNAGNIFVGGSAGSIPMQNLSGAYNSSSVTSGGYGYIAKFAPNPLPIELVSFTAKPVNNKTVLTEWITASEVNSDYFTIERSKEGKSDSNWEYVGNVDGAGNSSTALNYELEDKTPYKGTSYYRLKQTDFNGDFEYFGPVAVRLEGIDIINLYPNPAVDHIDYSVCSSLESNITITLVDVLGRKVTGATNEIKTGENKLKLDVSGYAQGMYMIQLQTESGNYRTQKQFVVK